jgi:hypothetical protein
MAVDAMVSQGFAGELVYIQIYQNEDREKGKKGKDETRRKQTEYSVVIYNSSHKSGHSSGLVRLRLKGSHGKIGLGATTRGKSTPR